jgi:hypothetical protein
MKRHLLPALVLMSLLTVSGMADEPLKGFIGIRDGYFYDKATGEPWVPHGIAYQTWNRPLGVWQTPEQIDYDLDEMVKMGANSIRVDFVWKQIEEKADNQFAWTNYDYLVQAAEQRGIRIFALIGYQWPPDWFPDAWYTQHPPSFDSEGIYHNTRWPSDIINYEHPQARAQYAEWFQNVCSRYKDSKAIVGWIIGNESGYLGLWSGLQDGFDPESEAAFRQWVTAKYVTLTNVNARWGTSYANWSNLVFIDEYTPYGPNGAVWANMVQWREDSIGTFTAIGAKAAKAADTNHLISYSTVGMQWGEEDWRYHAEDRGKITRACAATNAPIDFFSVNNYPWSVLGHESQNGQWGISFTKFATRAADKPNGVPVLYSETGFTSSETMWPGMNQFRQGPLVRNALWESLEAGAIGTHIFSWMDRPYITDREKGFGILTADRRIKASYWVSRDAFTLMNQVKVQELLAASKDPKPDIAFLWTAANDSQYNRYECEMQQLAGACERLGFEPNFMYLEDLAAGAYTNYKVVVLPRNMRVDRVVPGYTNSVLNFLLTRVIPRGVHVLASADLPGMQDENGRPRAEFTNEVAALFGIDAGDVGGCEAPARTKEYVSWYWNLITVSFNTNAGALNGYYCWPFVWKYSDEIKATSSGVVWATMNTLRNKGFEDSDTATPGWLTYGRVSVVSNQPAQAYEGRNYALLDSNACMWADFPVMPNGRYTASAFLRNHSTNPISGVSAFVALEWLDKSQNLLGVHESPHMTNGAPTNVWQKFSVDALAPSNAYWGRRIIRIGRHEIGQNLLSNPGLTLDYGKDAYRPYTWMDYHLSEQAVENGHFRSGPNAWAFWYEGFLWQDISTGFEQGDQLTVGGWLYTPSSDPLRNGTKCGVIALEFRNSDGPSGVLATNYTTTISASSARDQWQNVEARVVVPAGTTFIRVLVRCRNPGSGDGRFYADDIYLRRDGIQTSGGRGTVLVDNNSTAPAVVVKNHGTAKSAIFLYSSGDIKPDGTLDGEADVYPWKWRYDILGSMLKNYFNVQPVVSLTGTNAYLCLPEYRTCADGSTLWQVKNYMYDTNFPASWTDLGGGAPQTFTITSSLFKAQTVMALGQGKILTTNCNGSITLTLEPDGMEMLHVYPVSPVAVSTQAVGFWKFEEASWTGAVGEVRDSSGNNNHGRAINGATTVARGKCGRGAWFDGTNDSVQIPNSASLQLTNDLTISFWIQPGINGSRVNPVDKNYGGEYSLTIETNRGMTYYHGNSKTSGQYWSWTAIPAGKLVNGEWQHVAITRQRSTRQMFCYLNGIRVGSTTYSTNPVQWPKASTNSVTLGRGYTGYTLRWQLDEVKIVGSVLASNQVLAECLNRFNKPNVQIADAPSEIHPMGDKCFTIKVRYDCLATNGLRLKVAFAEKGDNGDGVTNEIYQSLSSNVTGSGETTFWMWIPDYNLADPDYISTPDGGQYQIKAWLENASNVVVASSLPVPTRLTWGIRPTVSLPTQVSQGGHLEIPVEWEDLYEPMAWEGTPMTRNSSFPGRVGLFRSIKTETRFPGHYDRVNAVANWLESMGYSSGNPLDISFDNIVVRSGPVAPPAPQVHWAMNEGSGLTVADDSGNGYNGSISGAVTWVAGKAGQALNCASNLQFVNIGPVDLSNVWTIAAWFKYPLPANASWNTLTRGSSTDHQIIVQRPGMMLGTYISAAFRSSGYSMTNLSAGWHHITAVGTGGVTRFYIDGAQVGSVNYQSTENIKAIGNAQGGSQQFGVIDEVAVYGIALTDAQVAGEFNKLGTNIAVISYQDSFADGDCAGWQRHAGSGNWGVSSNSLRAWRIGNDDNIVMATGYAWSNSIVSADIRYNVLGPYYNDAELYVRFIDRNNFVKVGLRNFYGFWRLMGVVKVGGCVQENKILYNFSKTNQPVANVWYNLKAEIAGNVCTFYLNNQPLPDGVLDVSGLPQGGVAVGAKAGQLGIWEPQKGYYFIDDDEYSYWAPEGQPTPDCGTPMNLDVGYLDAFFPTLILPGTYVMSDIEVSNVVTWLHRGLRSLIATDGGVAMMNENGEHDIGRIEDLFGMESFVYQDFNNLSNLLLGATGHYVTMDYIQNWEKRVPVSGTAKSWPQPSGAASLATLYAGPGNVPALLANKLMDDPQVPKKVFCFNFDAAANNQLTNRFAKRAFEWTQGDAYQVTLALKYNNGNPNYDPTVYSTTAWILSGSGSNTVVMDLPSSGLMTGTNLYWVMYAHPWDAEDPWLEHGGFYSSLNDGIRVSMAGQGLQILGATDKAFAGRDWDLWVAYNTTGQPVTATYGVKDKTQLLFEDTFCDGNINGWGLESAQNYSISWVDGSIKATHIVGFGYAKFRHNIGPMIRSRNCTLEFDVLYETPNAKLSILYQDRGPYSSPAIPPLVANASTTGIWHHVELHVHDGWVYDYAVNGDVVRLSYPLPGLNPNYQEYIGFFAFDGNFRIDNIRLTDQEYSSVPKAICGQYVPTNSAQAFWASVPDYDPDQLEHNGTAYGSAYEWYVQFKNNQMEARKDVGVYFAPRLRDEVTNFPSVLQPASIAKVPVEWEYLDGLVPAKLRIELAEPILGLNVASADFDITAPSGVDEFPIGVPGGLRASDYYLWAAYIYPTNATDPMGERIGLDDTFRFDMHGRPVQPETMITVAEIKDDPYVLYDDSGVVYHGQVFTWGSSVTYDGQHTNVTSPEGDLCFLTDARSSYGAGWGIFKYYNGAPQYADMRTFSNGTICFWLNSSNTIKIELEGPQGTKRSINVASTGGTWREFILSVTNFAGVDLANMYGLFSINQSSIGKYLVDYVRWEGAMPASNQPPVVSAGSDLAVLYKDGVGRSPIYGAAADDGLPSNRLAATWSQVSGPGTVGFSSVTALHAVATFPVVGSYVLRLTASDGLLSAFDEASVIVDVQVGPVNQAPNAYAGADAVTVVANPYQLMGVITDDGLPSNVTFASWSKVSGPGTVAFGNAANAQTTVSFPQAGTYVLRLTGFDGQLRDSDDVTITVEPYIGLLLGNGDTVPASIGVAGEIDTYVFYGRVGDVVKMRMGDRTASSSFDLSMTLKSPAGDVLATSSGEENAEISRTLIYEGFYTITCREADTTTGNYALSILWVDEGHVLSAADSDIGEIRNGQSRLGNINQAGDMDASWFTAQTGDVVKIRMADRTGSSTFDVVVYLYGPDGQYIAGASGDSTAEIVTTIQSNGTYLIECRESDVTVGGYALSMLWRDSGHELYEDTDLQEIGNGQTLLGNINQAGDLDASWFNAEAGDIITIRMADRTGSSGFDMLVSLYGPNGEGVASASGSGDMTAGFTVTITNSGPYLIECRETDVTTGAYALSALWLDEGHALVADTDLPDLHNGETILGTINQSGDMDATRFTAQVGDVVLLRMGDRTGSSIFDMEMYVYDAAGHYIASVGGDDTATLSLTITNSGLYTVRCQEADVTTGGYALSALWLDEGHALVADTDLPDLHNGETILGTINQSGDMDATRFTAQVGDVVLLQMGDRTGSSIFDMEMYVYDAAGHYIASVGGDDTATLSLTITNSGLYTVRCQEADVTTGGYALSALWLDEGHALVGDTDLPDLRNGETVLGTINQSGDMDATRFTAQVGDVVLLRMGDRTGSSTFDMEMYVYDAAGRYIASVGGDDTATLSLTITNSGLYTVRCQEADVTTGAYALSALWLDDNHALVSDTNIGWLTNGVTRTGTINQSGDMDAAFFNAASNQAVTVLMTDLTGSSTFDLVLYLYGPDGRYVAGASGEASAQISTIATNAGQYTAVLLETDTTTGNYNVRVTY